MDISDNNSHRKNLSPSIDPTSQVTPSGFLIYTTENPNPNPTL